MDGVIEVNDVPMRQVPSYSFSFGYSTWITEDGRIRNRYFNPKTLSWNWGDFRKPVLDCRVRVGFNVYGRFRTTEQLIALAWIPRTKPMMRMKRVMRKEMKNDAEAHNLFWCDEEHSEHEEESSDSEEEDDDSKKPLAFKMGMVPCVNDQLMLSRKGRIHTPQGVFRGSYALGPCRFFPVFNVGLVPLNLASQLVFTGKRDKCIGKPPPRIARVMQHIRRGLLIGDISRLLCIKRETAWSYVHAALQHMSTSSARKITEHILSSETTPPVLKALSKLSTETPVILGGRLQDVVYTLTQAFAVDPAWREYKHRYSVVCISRTLLQREVQTPI